MQLDKMFLEIAKKDLVAAEILHNNGLYPQAVFYLQQSVEKTSKSFALMSNIITAEELREIGHHPFLILKKLLDAHGEKLDTIHNVISKIPELRDLTIFKELNVSDQYEDLEKTDKTFDQLVKVKKELIFYPKEYYTKLFEELKQIELEIKEKHSKITEEDLRKFGEHLIPFSALVSDKFPHISLENINKQELEEYIGSKEFIDLLKKIIPAIFDLAYIFPSLIYLSVITFPHAVIARYPQNGLNPLEIYTDELPIIRFFGDCTKIMGKVIEKIKCFRKDMQEVNQNAIH